MDNRAIFAILLLVLAVTLFGFIMYLWLFGRKESELDVLMRTNRGGNAFDTPQSARDILEEDSDGEQFQRLKDYQRKQFKKKANLDVTMEERYYHAGIFSKRERREFERLKWLVPSCLGPIFGFGAWFGMGGSLEFGLYGLLIGALVGLKAPSSILDRKVKKRGEDIMYYLPLVIEQIAIGVSSSLDIGPCLQRVVLMADERDSHNVVTELVKHAQHMIKSGMSLDEALMEVGTKSGHTDLKHAFMALSQVSKHGGEISKQLMELADAVAARRESLIDEKIRKLELEATGPVALVFLGFILILMIGFGVQLKNAF